jgi:hypothetical protein
MTGMRATSGSVAIWFRNVRMHFSESSMPASMLTSSTFAPLRTCWTATSTAASKSPASISLRKRAEPDTFVRSPTTTKLMDSSNVSVSSPLKNALPRRAAAGASRSRVRRSATPCVMARMWSGVVPQHPPTMSTRPDCANSRSSAPVVSGASSYSPNALGNPAFG